MRFIFIISRFGEIEKTIYLLLVFIGNEKIVIAKNMYPIDLSLVLRYFKELFNAQSVFPFLLERIA